ncbi:peptide deformylase [Thermodesulfatator indicus DSM 15286]|uniref:Peptide deformylase n=1 Tax=Thermodesulfatator indicus (strain DSM 15286 / JCM 11887 / CIR29812) TaxID=667014 RepID=F8A9I4_THEID|nr:peptide deformylase [Thermodesulfatator indicus]AEH44132.1 peptide deformylase [Thermodesulfatator indicus DSM 15286]
MSKRKIRILGDPVLRETAKPVSEIDGELQSLIDDMAETMYEAKGLGLAANQVGELKRLFVLDLKQREGSPELLVFINPEIVEAEGEIVEEEGCLSIPGYSAKVKRKAKVLVKALDREGNPFEMELEGLGAKAIQHELDHLNGRLYIDYLSPLKKNLFKRWWKKHRPK